MRPAAAMSSSLVDELDVMAEVEGATPPGCRGARPTRNYTGAALVDPAMRSIAAMLAATGGDPMIVAARTTRLGRIVPGDPASHYAQPPELSLGPC